jgi:hypothetical protein
LDRTRSGEVDLGEEDAAATDVLRDSTFLDLEGPLEGRRAGDLALGLGLGGFLEGVLAAAFRAGFTDLAFK